MTTATDTKPGTDAKPAEAKKPRRATPNIADLDVNAIVTQATHAPTVVREQAQPMRERKPAQLAMDKVVKQAHADWVKQGKPGSWSKITPVTYFLDPGLIEGYKYLIRRAVDFHGTRVRFGTPFRLTEDMAVKAGRPKTDAGKEVLTFAIMDKAVSKKNAKPEAATPATPPQTAAK